MVKGITRQVVVVRPQGDANFEEAVFILRENAKGLTEEELCREAGFAVRGKTAKRVLPSLASFASGAGFMGLLWALCSFL